MLNSPAMAIRCALLLIIFFLTVTPLRADGSLDSVSLRKEFQSLETLLDSDALSAPEVEDAVSKVSEARSRVLACIQQGELRLSKLHKEKEAFELETPEPLQLDAGTRGELETLEADFSSQQAAIVDCQLLSRRAQSLLDELTIYKGTLLVTRLQQKSRAATEIAAELVDERQDLTGLAVKSVAGMGAKLWRQLGSSFVWMAIAVVSLVLGVLLAFFRPEYRERLRCTNGISSFNRFSLSLRESILHYAYAVLPLSAVSIGWLMLPADDSPEAKLLHAVCYLFTAYVWLSVFLRALLRPANQQWLFVPIKSERRAALAYRLKILLLILSMAIASHWAISTFDFPDSVARTLRLVMVVALCFNLVWLIWLLDGLERLQGRGRGLRTVLIFILLVTLFAELLGYLNLSAFLIRGFLGTLLSVFILWLLNEFTVEIFDGLDSGKRAWHQQLRQRLAIQEGEHIPGLVWFRILAVVIVWLMAATVFLKSWELSQVSWTYADNLFNQGFSIGELRLVPAKILIGIVLFASVLLLSSAIKSRLRERSNLLARLEPSARETVVTLTGYAGFIIALLIGLSLAGFGFQNLAIVAGALSLGIGFGLQNIVNNFVSGIILLFERPIRRGDWVVVGGTEGFVKNIRVRSTEIETFDRSDVVVPNSEFISGQVTNWTLNDPNGRVRIPISVAYGSDVEQVREILLEIANQHDSVLKAGNFRQMPEPIVLFMSFGDSSLDFELRCFVHDIRSWPVVRSDINFAVDREFRKANIQIPFPQRDVHIISPHLSKPGGNNE